MIEINEVEGRFEVFSLGRHWEVFEGRLGAQAAALALAAELQLETASWPEIAAPWPVYPAVRARPTCRCLPPSTWNPATK